MWRLLLFLLCGSIWAQDGQQAGRPGWPCVAGRAVDPAYLETSESTGGQLFLFQKNEIAHASLFMSASFTHPATVLRAVGNLAGTRDYEFPVDSTMESFLVMASLQCRNSIRVLRPNGAELTAANSAQSVDLQAGRILRIDFPEPGKWKVRLTGAGLFVLSVAAKTNIRLTNVSFFAVSGDRPRLVHPLFGVRQSLEAHLTGDVSAVQVQVIGPSGDVMAGGDVTEAPAKGDYGREITPASERFRIAVSGTDAAGWPFQRTDPVLFRAVPAAP
jgi:hypothetical protein